MLEIPDSNFKYFIKDYGMNFLRKKLIFDSSVLVNAYLSGDIFKTGIYRVSFEILRGLIQVDKYNIYLFDLYGREREIRKYVAPKFQQVKVLPLDSKMYKTFVYPLFNFTDHLRIKEYQTKRPGLKLIYRFCKNCFHTLARALRYFEKKKKVTSNFLNFNDSDIYLSTYNRIPLNVSFLSKLRKAIIIHDLIPIIHPEYFYNHENKEILEAIIESISDNDNVICVSESTKCDFLKYRPSFKIENIFVSHLAGAECFHPILSANREETVKEKYKISYQRSYYLSVCTIEPRKNIGLLIKVYERLLKYSKGKDMPLLVLTGAVGWESQSLLENINRINNAYNNSVILTGFVNDEDLAILYSHALCFVYPSLYEGFGLPPLEAMQCGAPVIASNNSSLPEVVGRAAILIDAGDEEALLNALITCLDSNKTHEMRKKSLQRAALFSWNKTISNIVNILN